MQAWVYLGQMKHVRQAVFIQGGDWVRHVTAKLNDIEMWWQDVDTVFGLHESEE